MAVQLKYAKAILSPTEGIQKVTVVAWSPNCRKLAVVTTDRVVHLFDENGEKKDKFSTKPSDPDPERPKTYVVRGMAFSPDSAKLAIAQSDNIVFVYKLGLEWGEKKSICNKLPQNCSVTCLAWPAGREGDVLFGLADGKVKTGQLRTNKSAAKYAHPDSSYCVSLACKPDGSAVVSGHIDGTLYTYQLDDTSGVGFKMVVHGTPPYALAWGSVIAAGGSDGRLALYTPTGTVAFSSDGGKDREGREFSCAAFTPAGDALTVGGFNAFFTFAFSREENRWREADARRVKNLYVVSAAQWKPDGSQLAVGSLTGAVDLFSASLRRYVYKETHEVTFVSEGLVNVRDLRGPSRVSLVARLGGRVGRVNVYASRFVVARTAASVLVGDLHLGKSSEVPWRSTGAERFVFDYPQVCLIEQGGEVSIVEYGRDDVVGTCRAAQLSALSVRLTPAQPALGLPEQRRLAFLADPQSARMVDLATSAVVATVKHTARIAALDLNPACTHLLVRDARRALLLHSFASGETVTLLGACSFAAWAPGSDVIVAQSQSTLTVWPSAAAAALGSCKVVPNVRRDVRSVAANPQGRTDVLYDDGSVAYTLDDSLLAFAAAVEARDLDRALSLLDQAGAPSGPETDGLWAQLDEAAQEDGRLDISERCAGAVGNVARVAFLRRMRRVAAFAAPGTPFAEAARLEPRVKAEAAKLARQWAVAEALLLEQGLLDEAIDMYKALNKWDEAVAVAEGRGHPAAEALRRERMEWLLATRQEERAGLLREREGDVLGAIDLYVRAGRPTLAASAIAAHLGHAHFDPGLVAQVLEALRSAGLFERQGEFLEALGRPQEAKEAYRRGRAYRAAVALAQAHFPGEVARLEEEWAEWLSAQRQTEAAAAHFERAGQLKKAIDAAVDSKQWAKAVDLVERLVERAGGDERASGAAEYYGRLARHFELARDFDRAEQFYLRSGLAAEAVEMYVRADKWDAAARVAGAHLTPEQRASLFARRARDFEAASRLKDAERMFLSVGQHDDAILMYKRHRAYDHMVRLVAQFRRDLLLETHRDVAAKLEREGSRREAEKHYVEANDWKRAVDMYRGAGAWEDALRVAKGHGGAAAGRAVAFAWAQSLDRDAGVALLQKMGLLEAAIDFAADSGKFDYAFDLANGARHKVPEVYLKRAMHLEDQGSFEEAEREFLAAGKPREAIEMWLHCQQWEAALRVAEGEDPGAVPDVHAARAKAEAEAGRLQEAELLLLRAGRPGECVRMYQERGQWEEALRVAEQHQPQLVPQLREDWARELHGGGRGGAGGAQGAIGPGGAPLEALLQRARQLERAGDFSGAAAAYLEVRVEGAAPGGGGEEHPAAAAAAEAAARLAVSQLQGAQRDEALRGAARNFKELGRVEKAAGIFESLGALREAADCFIEAGMFDRAQGVGQGAMAQYIEERRRDLAARGGPGAGGAGGGAAAGDAQLELLAAQGDWARVHELVARGGPQAAAQWGLRHAAHECRTRDFASAAAALARFGAPAHPANFAMYRDAALGVLSGRGGASGGEEDVRAFLAALVNSMSLTPEIEAQALSEFRRLLDAAHLACVRARAAAAGLAEQAARAAAAQLRHVDGIVPADRAFFEAGIASRDAGWTSMAFVFLNRYLDVTEAMEERARSSEGLDPGEFARTDIPVRFPLRPPEEHFVPEATREEVRDWVLELSMDPRVQQQLPTRVCGGCGKDTFAGALRCHGCKARSEMCVVTGWPVSPAEKVTCGRDHQARREDWNVYVQQFRQCPWCNAAAQPKF